MRVFRALFGAAFAALVVLACDAGYENQDVDVVDPSNPTVHVTVTKDVVDLCSVMCSALIADYGVPPDQQDACVFQCADGFATTPDACYELVSCVHDADICANGDVSPDCRARAGPCLSHWAIPNGLCRGCWKPNRTITGVRQYAQADATGASTIPVDLSSKTVAASFPTPTGFLAFPGSGQANGHFSVPDVPGCPTWLQVDNTYFWVTTDAVDLTDPHVGLVDAVSAGMGTELDVDATNLAPWTDPSVVEAVTPNQAFLSGGYYPLVPPNGVIPAGTTQTTLAFPWDGLTLLDAGRGDVTYLAQYSPYAGPLTTSTGVPMVAAVRFATAPAFTMASGTATHVPIAFAPIAKTGVAHFDLRRPDFFSALPDMAASKAPVTFAEWGIVVHGTYGAANGDGATFDLAFAPQLRTSPGPLDLGDMTYPNPLPDGWELRATADFYYPVSLSAEGLSLPQGDVDPRVSNEIRVDGPLDDMVAAPVVPILSQARHLRVAGTDVTAPPNGDPAAVLSSGAGVTPVITWDAPTTGTVSYYQLVLSAFAGGKSFVARTTETTVRVPPGVIDPAHAYWFRLLAFGSAGKRGVTASTVSGVIRP